MITELTGTIIYENGHEEAFTAPLTDEVDESGCKVYEAKIPIHRDDEGHPWWFKTAKVDVIPGKSALRFSLVEELC